MGGLNAEERAVYEWQLWVPGFGEAGQEKLKGATVLVSRVGGVGGAAALYLAAAGVGKIILAHGGNLKPSDLNRQTLMTHAALGTPRAGCARERLRDLNPHLEVEAVAENLTAANAERHVAKADLVISAAPLFQERLALNAAAVRLGKPLVNCAMCDLHVQVLTVIPGRTACLACLTPEVPPDWKRQFPVFGAVAGVAGAVGAMEAIKVLAGLGTPLAGTLWELDLRDMTSRRMVLPRVPDCPVCGGGRVKEKQP